MSSNNFSISEIDTLIEMMFSISDALQSLDKLKNASSAPRSELTQRLSESYAIVNDLLNVDDSSTNEVRVFGASHRGTNRLC